MKHEVKSEPQNIEYRTAEFRSVESLRSVFYKKDRIHYSMFDVGRSMFNVHLLIKLARHKCTA